MAEFLHMGGYGLYVWGCFASGLAVLIWNVLAPYRERRALLREWVESE